jgi:DGQHR domain-containing protein
MTRRRKTDEPTIAVRAVRTEQAGKAVYAFFVAGAELLQIAEISRVHRGADGSLQGFQRKGIRSHVQAITEFLDQGPVLFPNAIILAISPRAHFVRARGEKPEGDIRSCEAGTLRIPLPADGRKEAWIVDGQQRSIALSQTQNKSFPVPVVAFVSEELAVHREQFILVNRAKPLDSKLIDELLPEVETSFPRDLSSRRLPSELVNRLRASPDSPFRGLVRRPSDESGAAIVTDSALVKAIRNSINSPLGALASYQAVGSRPADIDAMYRILVAYWNAVSTVFPEAWGLPPTESRLMHSAGIAAMTVLMDCIMPRADQTDDPQLYTARVLRRIAPKCHWTNGRWDDLSRDWNEIQNVGRDIKQLSTFLVRQVNLDALSKVA